MKTTRMALAAAALLMGAVAHAQSVLKISYSNALTSHYGVGAVTFCEGIEKGTQGRYKCQQFPNNGLGGEREMIEAVQLGTQDLANVSTGALGNFVPETKIVDIPFLFRDYDHARKVMDGPIGQDLLKKMAAKGIVGLAWTENGFRHMTNNKRAIQTPEDAKGLKLRTMENKVHMDGYRTFGLLPTPMAWPEVYTALQQGTVDGQENPIPVILSNKLQQVQKHLSLTNHVYSPAVLIVSQMVWDKLSPADRKVFQESANKAAQVQRMKVNDDESNGIAQLEKDGMQVVRQVNSEAFRKAVTPAYTAFSKEFGADKIAAIQAVK